MFKHNAIETSKNILFSDFWYIIDELTSKLDDADFELTAMEDRQEKNLAL
jgi:hypothetical protein